MVIAMLASTAQFTEGKREILTSAETVRHNTFLLCNFVGCFVPLGAYFSTAGSRFAGNWLRYSSATVDFEY